ncbi:hypothetical protein BFP70_18055 [Thioclava sp. SK-1]|uniref:ROK family protein n=1 Tax=Thioclava sp. SK-1 TaxID=1889770 RepID=UPI0008268AF8|nr:ROK family protein [Thioclava sp. SK-1]OCX60002.1 hypothetical protein BFP70_18055 [Thioclava sp. SK-1]
MQSGGIDLGGTKIEARLFDAGFNTCVTRRIATPSEGYDRLCAALAEQIGWLHEQAGGTLPIGIGFPGIMAPQTQQIYAANLPLSGSNLVNDIKTLTGCSLALVNDSLAFALSEATLGAGQGYDSVLGLIIGTGVGAGLAIDGRLIPRCTGLALEVGHLGVPARWLAQSGLPLRQCGCKKLGCYEAYLAGPGLSWMAAQALSRDIAVPDLVVLAETDFVAKQVLNTWSDLAGELLLDLHLNHDPGVIVLGGGLSKIPGVLNRLQSGLERCRLGTSPLPQIALAEHGDSSGARGAAIFATQQLRGG